MVRPTGLAGHPDVVELRETYDRAGSTAPAQIMEGLTFLAGLYLAISPWVIGFHPSTSLTVNNLIVGLAVAALALGCASAFGRTYGVSWVLPLLGVWSIISPWVVRGAPGTPGAVWNNVGAGILILLFGAGALASAYFFRRHERGERAGHRLGTW
ncbi:SPW repeat protein [Microbispora sp. RL4-1S]|uniref:SPW repeat protein n=1 Tax=Microbispora oryzae TaxID=2806554 RepID=A0A941AHF5_9ACTN|nr:SPW repeat protein [Microbispora oryzae]MBP2704035.1 SPW repeat protein [Microbispora oryzae]